MLSLFCGHRGGTCSSDSEQYIEVELQSWVPSGLFAAPAPMSRSGGTAAFFRIDYVGDPSNTRFAGAKRCPAYWIGKDLARAADELGFYEQIASLDRQSFRLLHLWAMEFGGVLSARCRIGGEDMDEGELERDERQLLLLQNLRADTKLLRMLDIKLGEETAVAGWKGKSAEAAMRNRVMDKMTNSSKEGFRLEGFDNQPLTLRSQAEQDNRCVSFGKRSRRFKLQRLRALEFLSYWADNSDLDWDHGVEPRFELLSRAEHSECLLFDAGRQLAKLTADALAMPVPQMWIGSSVALACEGGQLLERKRAFASLANPEVHRSVVARIKVFDWGRSELNTPEAHAKLTLKEQQKRSSYWEKWLRGALRVLFDCVCLYKRQFCGNFLGQGCEICVQAWDFDVLEANDIIGMAMLPLEPTNGRKVVRLHRVDGNGDELKAEVEIEVLKLELPPFGRTRLASSWCVIVHNVRNFPRMDVFSATDPLIVVQLRSEHGAWAPQLQTPVRWNDPNADFNAAPLDFGTVLPAVENAFFRELSMAFGSPVGPELFKLASPDWQIRNAEAEVLDNEDANFEAFLRAVPSLRGLSR